MSDPHATNASSSAEPAPPVVSRGSVISGAKWASTIGIGLQALQFLVGLALARLLAPEEFGLIASVYVVTNFASILFNMGLAQALIHQSRPTEQDKSTVFWLNLFSGLVYAALMLAAAPWVADFFNAPALVGLMPIVALSFTVSLGVVQAADLQRALRFKRLAFIELGAAVLGNTLTVSLAVAGVGALALALGPLLTAFMTTVFFFVAAPWRPRSFISRASLRRIWSFSAGMVGFNVINYWSRNADNLLIGRTLGPTSLAYYNRGYNFMLLPVWQITGTMQRVMFPALASMRDDRARVRGAYLRAVRLVSFVSVPMLVGIAAVSEGLVPLLWGGQWNPVVPLLQLLCLAGTMQCIATTAGWLFQSQGRTTLMFGVGAVSAVIVVSSVVIGLAAGGLMGVAVATLVSSYIIGPLNLYFAGRIVDLPLASILRAVAPTALCAAVMGTVVALLPWVLGADGSAPWCVAVQVAIGVLLYLGLSLVAQRETLKELLSLARRGS